MTKPADRYLRWLKQQVAVENNHKDYHDVLERMFQTEFVWLPQIWSDEDRVQDGLYLRYEFGVKFEEPCSVLEAMVALSRRLEFIVGGTAPGWAWQFMINLRLDHFHDPVSPRRMNQVADILEDLVYRNYAKDGTSGFFPLKDPDRDQTKLEIWYQMAAYVDEILPE